MTTQFSPPPVPGTASPNGRHTSAAEYPTSGYVPGGFVPDQSGALPPAPPPAERLPRMRRPRRPALAAGGVALVALCGVTSAALATAGDQQVQVLTLAHDVQYGQTLTADDLRVARISGSGVQALSAAGLSNVVGQTVTASLPAGTLLNDSMLSSAPLPAGGLQLVAVAVKPGGVPEQAAPGRVVSLLRILSPTAGDSKGATATVLVAQARLASITRDDATGLQILSVEVPQAAALAVAQASAAGAIAITLLPVAG